MAIASSSSRAACAVFAKKIARADETCGKQAENAVDQTDFRLDNVGLENRPRNPSANSPMNSAITSPITPPITPFAGLRTWSVECRI
jgi:hypothetical protein